MWVAASVQKCDIQLHGDIRTGRDLVCARACGVKLASLRTAISLQVHTLLHCVETHTLCECTLHLASQGEKYGNLHCNCSNHSQGSCFSLENAWLLLMLVYIPNTLF